MKTIVIISLVVLFILSVYFYCTRKSHHKITECDDKRIDKIRRAQKNLHPVINRNVDRDETGRFCKKS